ncbi:MAG: signal peptide peptidase SppA [Rikenellaceae bacterium]|nr:signal peptide peptidase SppA [Rikenellaceae bacterium]
MKRFFQTFFACLAAIFASFILVTILSLFIFSGIIAVMYSKEAVSIKPGSVLKIELSEIISDAPPQSFLNDFNPFSMSIKRRVSLLDVISSIENATYDDNIKGIYLNLNPNSSIGLGMMEEIRTELLRFKSSGKFIVSYADYYTQGTYYLSSVADKIFINPEGGIAWRGMSSQVLFFKGALDKLGLKVEVVRVGDYKSAVEPFTSDRMSPENKLQTQHLIGGIWGNIVRDISQSRGIDSALLQRYASELTIANPMSAYDVGMVDSIAYVDQVADYLAGLTDKRDAPEIVNFSSYISSPSEGARSRNKIAVIYAEGEIIDGRAPEGYVGSRNMRVELRSALDDRDVKAVVLRVNSPGGSALASEVIWREVGEVRADKPIIISMGNYAASGGYYISAPADFIFANRSTITGSIGVFDLMLNVEDGLKDKLGITVDGVTTNDYSDLASPFRPLEDPERRYLQNSVKEVYETFVNHVANGRNLSADRVREIGSGRVWSGLDAQRIGLVDAFGGLKDAILFAAERVGIADNFRIVSKETEDDLLSSVLRNLLNNVKAEPAFEIEGISVDFSEFRNIMEYRKGVQALMPYKLYIQ